MPSDLLASFLGVDRHSKKARKFTIVSSTTLCSSPSTLSEGRVAAELRSSETVGRRIIRLLRAISSLFDVSDSHLRGTNKVDCWSLAHAPADHDRTNQFPTVGGAGDNP